MLDFDEGGALVEEVDGEGVSKGMSQGALGDLGPRCVAVRGANRRIADVIDDGANRQLLRAIERINAEMMKASREGRTHGRSSRVSSERGLG